MRTKKLSLIAVGLAISGCGTHLVFVNPSDGVRPNPEAASSTCEGSSRRPSSDKMLDQADVYRDELLATRLPRFDPSPPVSADEVGSIARRQQQRAASTVQQAMSRWKQAQVCYEAALQLDPSLSYALINLTVISLRIYDLDPDVSDREQYFTRAQNYLSRASDVNKYDAQISYYQAEMKVRKQQWAEAEKTLKYLLAQGWNRANVHNLLGYVYQMTGREGLARDEWIQATQVDHPAQANAWAIQKTRPPPPSTGAEPRAPAATSVDRWDYARQQMVPATPPSLPKPCYWMENGRTQC